MMSAADDSLPILQQVFRAFTARAENDDENDFAQLLVLEA